MEQSMESNFVEKFKAIASTAQTLLIFQIFLYKKKFLIKSIKLGHGNLVLMLQVE